MFSKKHFRIRIFLLVWHVNHSLANLSIDIARVVILPLKVGKKKCEYRKKFPQLSIYCQECTWWRTKKCLRYIHQLLAKQYVIIICFKCTKQKFPAPAKNLRIYFDDWKQATKLGLMVGLKGKEDTKFEELHRKKKTFQPWISNWKAILLWNTFRRS